MITVINPKKCQRHWCQKWISVISINVVLITVGHVIIVVKQTITGSQPMCPTAQLEKMKRTMLKHVKKNVTAKSQTNDITILRVEEPLEKLSLEDSSLKTDLGLCFCFGLGVLGLTRPCSSNISCCFLRRYSCFISSRRVFSSSLRKRSSSAFRLKAKQIPEF